MKGKWNNNYCHRSRLLRTPLDDRKLTTPLLLAWRYPVLKWTTGTSLVHILFSLGNRFSGMVTATEHGFAENRWRKRTQMLTPYENSTEKGCRQSTTSSSVISTGPHTIGLSVVRSILWQAAAILLALVVVPLTEDGSCYDRSAIDCCTAKARATHRETQRACVASRRVGCLLCGSSSFGWRAVDSVEINILSISLPLCYCFLWLALILSFAFVSYVFFVMTTYYMYDNS